MYKMIYRCDTVGIRRDLPKTERHIAWARSVRTLQRIKRQKSYILADSYYHSYAVGITHVILIISLTLLKYNMVLYKVLNINLKFYLEKKDHKERFVLRLIRIKNYPCCFLLLVIVPNFTG